MDLVGDDGGVRVDGEVMSVGVGDRVEDEVEPPSIDGLLALADLDGDLSDECGVALIASSGRLPDVSSIK